jgi:hypothetical protein
VFCLNPALPSEGSAGFNSPTYTDSGITRTGQGADLVMSRAKYRKGFQYSGVLMPGGKAHQIKMYLTDHPFQCGALDGAALCHRASFTE